MYMCPAVPFGVHLSAVLLLNGCICTQVGGQYGVSEEVVEEAVKEVVQENRE